MVPHLSPTHKHLHNCSLPMSHFTLFPHNPPHILSLGCDLPLGATILSLFSSFCPSVVLREKIFAYLAGLLYRQNFGKSHFSQTYDVCSRPKIQNTRLFCMPIFGTKSKFVMKTIEKMRNAKNSYKEGLFAVARTQQKEWHD